jgi:hypothetical protein
MGIVMMLFALHGLDRRTVGADLQGRFVPCMHAIFWVCSGLGVLGVFASLVRGRVREAPRS